MGRWVVFRRFLQGIVMLLVASAFLAMLWWAGDEGPVHTSPKEWKADIEVLHDYLDLAEAALDEGNKAEAVEWIGRAREQSATLKRDIQADHDAWVARYY